VNPTTLILYVLGVMILTVIVHESAHYYACKHYGLLRGYGIWKGNPCIDNSDYHPVVVLIGFFASLFVYPLVWLVPLYGWRVPFSYWVIYQALCSSYDFYVFFKKSVLGIPYEDKIYPRGINGWWFYIPYKEGER